MPPRRDRRAAPAARPRRATFVAALRARRPAIIAEIKRASPSKGDILPGLDPAAVARDYATGGAAAISVLTDRHFKGSLDDLRAVRARGRPAASAQGFHLRPVPAVRGARGRRRLYPADRRDAAQEGDLRALRGARARARAGGAGRSRITRTNSRSRERVGAELIGINNRDLHTFVTDIAVTERLLAGYRGDALIVSESGIETPDDIRRLDRAGARAFLIGESLLRGGAPARDADRAQLEALGGPTATAAMTVPRLRQNLRHHPRRGCALRQSTLGADMIGLNFYPPSPRCLSSNGARRFARRYRRAREVVGVFVNAARAYIDGASRSTATSTCCSFTATKTTRRCADGRSR